MGVFAANDNVVDREKREAEITSQQALHHSHADFLVSRHGTVDLEPIPDPTHEDPLNWTTPWKLTVLILVAFHAFMATFTASSIQSSFVHIADDLDISVQRTSYLSSLVIAVLGGAPLLWKPLANRWGRRPILLVSLLGSLAGNIGCANSPNYAAMAACRAIVAFFICPAAAIGTGVVVELFFKMERARYVGIWAICVTLGIPLGPLIFGFVVERVSYRWIYYVLAITNGVQLILWLFLGRETLYVRTPCANGDSPPATASQSYLTRMMRFRRINPEPLTALDFCRPLRFIAWPCVLLPAIAYAMVFSFASVLISFEIPELYPAEYGFNSQQVGLQFISLIIGTIIGELLAGRLSDYWMTLDGKSHGETRFRPEFRLHLSYPATLVAIAGTVVFLVCNADSTAHWSVSPLVGAAIAAAGNQIVTTILITYAVDCHREEAASIGVFITFVRQIWGFIGPFWYPEMIDSIGFRGSAGVAAGLMAAFSLPTALALQIWGKNWR